jgi:UPF0755 protein
MGAMARRRVTGVLILSIAALFLVVVAALWFYAQLAARREITNPEQIVTVEPGMSTREIVARLASSGVVPDQSALLMWLTVTGQGRSLKAGDYQFSSPISPLEVVDKIRKGEVATKRVTVPEGLTRFAIAKLLAEQTGLGPRERFLALTGRADLIRDLDPQARTLEGYLFPDTYEYTAKTTADELVAEMVGRFREVHTSRPEMTQLAAARNMTLHDLMTLASLVEEEARVDDERAVIASVFYNRLAKNMKLASDPTFVYAALMEDDYDGDVNNPRHRARVSPYNTYMFEGLPPGPIASPGWKSIEAVLKPAETQFLYFVVNGREGRHKFSRTVDEHERAVQEYRRQQAEERQAEAAGG